MIEEEKLFGKKGGTILNKPITIITLMSKKLEGLILTGDRLIET